jgi:hypothetical protein
LGAKEVLNMCYLAQHVKGAWWLSGTGSKYCIKINSIKKT